MVVGTLVVLNLNSYACVQSLYICQFVPLMDKTYELSSDIVREMIYWMFETRRVLEASYFSLNDSTLMVAL